MQTLLCCCTCRQASSSSCQQAEASCSNAAHEGDHAGFWRLLQHSSKLSDREQSFLNSFVSEPSKLLTSCGFHKSSKHFTSNAQALLTVIARLLLHKGVTNPQATWQDVVNLPADKCWKLSLCKATWEKAGFDPGCVKRSNCGRYLRLRLGCPTDWYEKKKGKKSQHYQWKSQQGWYNAHALMAHLQTGRVDQFQFVPVGAPATTTASNSDMCVQHSNLCPINQPCVNPWHLLVASKQANLAQFLCKFKTHRWIDDQGKYPPPSTSQSQSAMSVHM